MSFTSLLPVPPASGAGPNPAAAQRIYAALLGEHGAQLGDIDEVTRSTSRAFLAPLLDAARARAELPADPRQLAGWLQRAHERTAAGYREYLDGRHDGEPRRFFRHRSHAMHFLNAVAPTKLVDGAWLYGLLPHWHDARMRPLIRIYLEELGCGDAAQHHVLVYRQLLEQHGGARLHDLADAHHVQGAIQLALARHAAELLPEVIGFNLGYEQLPLHLPITAYELNELGIDPYYFSLHVTIDNASTGHAQKALQCALEAMPRAGDSAAFYRRMATGYALNDIGMGTVEAIESFDLEQELVSVLADKARIGAALHSDYCRIGGRTVAGWLGEPGGMPAFLDALVAAGWIRRRADPAESRFWRLLHDEQAPMFGVFDAYELQLIHDWIALPGDGSRPPHEPRRLQPNRFRRPVSARADAAEFAGADAPAASAGIAAVVGHCVAALPATTAADEDVRILRERLAGVDDMAAAMGTLRGFLSPAHHPSPAGLLAARIVSRLLGS